MHNAVAIADGGLTGEVRFVGEIENTATATSSWCVSSIEAKCRRITFCHEAGPTGYELQRHIQGLGHECIVAAPSMIPKKPGDRVKTSQRDAMSLVKLLRASERTAEWVMRDPTRARWPMHCDARPAKKTVAHSRGVLERKPGHSETSEKSMNFYLPDKVALVTGASRGIGEGIALELAAAGCDVMLTARSARALEDIAAKVEALGRRATVYPADLTAAGEPSGLVTALRQDFGRCDILVNNAGAVKRGNFFELTDKDWRDGFELKFFAHVRLCRLIWPQLKAASGSVVFISGIGARIPVADYMIGASVIGASVAFMKALADLGKQDGVQVNAVNPGSVDTDRFRRRLAIIMKKTGLDEAAAIEHHRNELGISRFGLPEDIAGLVRFIVSPRGRWLQGTSIDIDGGQVIPLRMSVYD